MPRAFSEDEKSRLRNRLLEAGKRLINRQGARNLRVDELAREAGIAKGSFYAFFPSREDFILTVLEAWEAQHRHSLLGRVLDKADRPREALQDLFAEAFSLLEQEPGLVRLGFKEVELLKERLPPERIVLHQAKDEAVLTKALGAWVEAGILQVKDLPAMEGLFMAIFVLALHREDFPPGTWAAMTPLLSEALALRLTEKRRP